MIGKSIAAFFIVLAFRYEVATALTISASLAQIGEFSFILAALAVMLGLLPADGQSLIVAGALISITLNPAAFSFMNRAARWVSARPRLLALLERPIGGIGALPATTDGARLRDHVVIVGYGRVGSAIGEILRQRGISYVIVEQNRELVEALQIEHVPILCGDAARPGVLAEAHIERAKLLVLATPDPYHARAIMDVARAVQPTIDTVARTHGEDERIYLERHGVGLALIGERELAFGLAHYALVRMGCGEDQADAIVDAARRGPPREGQHASGTRA